MNRDARRRPPAALLLAAAAALLAGAAGAAGPPVEVPILDGWSGEYPVAEIERLPEGQRDTAVGYLGDAETFAAVWAALRPGEAPPEIGFDARLVLFARNVAFHNATSIARVSLRDGVAEVLAIETMTSAPIEDLVAMSLAVVARDGIRAIDAGDREIPVWPYGETLAADPLDATYSIGGAPVHLAGGRARTPAAPGSATMVTTRVAGAPVRGDLDRDGDEDAVLLLVHDPGGSGTFHYLAAARREDGGWRGARAVLLGDRVAPGALEIRDGVIVADVLDRRPGEPMSTPPRVPRTALFVLDDGALAARGTLGPDDRLVTGWLVLGHEVREFSPCGGDEVLWLAGDSPVLAAARDAYRRALPGARPYAPLLVTLAGRRGPAPADGFGADHDGAFHADAVVDVRTRGGCRAGAIVVESPAAGATVHSPLAFRGRARGAWFFEGDFPVRLEDADGNVIARRYATARGEWMTRDFVPFDGTLDYAGAPARGAGALVFTKDNPSDRRDLDDEVRVPVFIE